jgi:hypothetical protein
MMRASRLRRNNRVVAVTMKRMTMPAMVMHMCLF